MSDEQTDAATRPAMPRRVVMSAGQVRTRHTWSFVVERREGVEYCWTVRRFDMPTLLMSNAIPLPLVRALTRREHLRSALAEKGLEALLDTMTPEVRPTMSPRRPLAKVISLTMA